VHSSERRSTKNYKQREAIDVRAITAISAALLIMTTCAGQQSTLSNFDRGRMEIMLDEVHSEIAKHYYDEKFHGLDVDARYEQYKKRIQEVQTLPEGIRVIAAYLAGLKDSHTFLEPPRFVNRVDYGYLLQMVGDRCFVSQVRPGTDAATKLHSGDEVLRLNGYSINRQDLWQFWYALHSLQPMTATAINRRSPDGQIEDKIVQATPITERQPNDLNFRNEDTDFWNIILENAQIHNLRQKDVESKGVLIGKQLQDLNFRNGDTDFWNVILENERQVHSLRQRYVESKGVLIWKMPAFLMQEGDVERMIGLARKNRGMILDLRGNPGGSVDVLEHLVGGVFDHEVQIAQRIGRKPMKPQTSKKSGDAFEGEMIVLVDGRSASAAELFARVMQLNHRAIVIGDLTSGSVMEARSYPLQVGSAERVIFYGVSITDADLVMEDGRSLENHGVVPDETVLPSAADMAAGRDPVLARAAEKLGVKLDAATAGSLFPFEWTPIKDE
jgi:hypothetical protein